MPVTGVSRSFDKVIGPVPKHETFVRSHDKIIRLHPAIRRFAWAMSESSIAAR